MSVKKILISIFWFCAPRRRIEAYENELTCQPPFRRGPMPSTRSATTTKQKILLVDPLSLLTPPYLEVS